MGQSPRFAEPRLAEPRLTDKTRFPEEETSPNPRLNSWKEIAAYLDRDPRTVQMWEKSVGLPVHRLNHNSRASVYAYAAEIDAWLHLRSLKNPQNPADEPGPEPNQNQEPHSPAWLLSAALSIKSTRIAAMFTLAFALLGNALAWYWVARRPALQPHPTAAPSCLSVPPSAR